MVKFTGVFDNSFASPMKPLDFVKEYYLSQRGRDELKDSVVTQESSFSALKNEESAQHILQQIKAEIAATVMDLKMYKHRGGDPEFVRLIAKLERQLSAV